MERIVNISNFKKLPSNIELLELYISDIECTNLTKMTIENYKSCLRDLFEFIDKSILDIDINDLKNYKKHLENKKNRYNKPFAPSTIGRYFTAIESFYEYLEYAGYIDKNNIPQFRKRYLKEYKKTSYNHGNSQRKPGTIEEMSLLVHSIIDPRDKAVVVLLAKTGIRRRELKKIDLEDIDWVDQCIHLKPTKKRSNCDVFFDDECARVLKRWMISRRNRLNNGTNALFLNERGGRLGRNGIYELFVKYSTKIGLHKPNSYRILDKYTPHNARHWFSTWLLRNGMKREYVQELRGDARKDAIDIYHHIDRQDLKDSYRAYIPQIGIL